MHRFQQKFIPWITLSKPVGISGRVALEPPGELGDNIGGRESWVGSFQQTRLVGKLEYSSLLPVKFGQVVVVVEERRDLCPDVLGCCDLFEKGVWEESRKGHVDPTKDVPRMITYK